MKDLIFYGIGSFAKLMKYYIDHDDSRRVVGIVVDDIYIDSNTSSFEGLPVWGSEYMFNHFSPNDVDVLCCIGYSNMNKNREKIFNKCKARGFSIASYIHSSNTISNDCVLGEGNIILEKNLIQPFVQIGDGNTIWCNTIIAHNSDIGNFNTIAGGASLAGFAKIRNNTFLGNRCVIRDNIEVADYTVVGANAYLSKNSSPGEVYSAARAKLLEHDSFCLKL